MTKCALNVHKFTNYMCITLLSMCTCSMLQTHFTLLKVLEAIDINIKSFERKPKRLLIFLHMVDAPKQKAVLNTLL